MIDKGPLGAFFSHGHSNKSWEICGAPATGLYNKHVTWGAFNSADIKIGEVRLLVWQAWLCYSCFEKDLRLLRKQGFTGGYQFQ